MEAAIAWVHATAISTKETNWKHIVSLYELIMTIRLSPVVALNRAIAIGQHEGPTRGAEEIHAIADCDRLTHMKARPREGHVIWKDPCSMRILQTVEQSPVQ